MTTAHSSAIQDYGLSTRLDSNTSALLEPSNHSASSLVEFAIARSSSSSVSETITSLDEVQGTLVLQNGFLLSDLTTPFGPLQRSYDLVSLATDLNESFQTVSGTLNLTNGIASGDLIVNDQPFSGSFEFANFVSSFVTDFLTGLNGTASVENGEIILDVPTMFGDVTGTIGFGNGRFTSDLTTPFGPVNFAFDFPAESQYQVSVPQLRGLEGVLNFVTGQLEIDLFDTFPGPELAVPLTSFAGDIQFNNGVATLEFAVGAERVTTQFNFAAEIGEELNEFLRAATGTLGISNGQLSANLTTSIATFNGEINASQLLNDFIATLPEYQGTITLANGSIGADLTTPYGPVTTTVEYASYLDDIASFVSQLS